MTTRRRSKKGTGRKDPETGTPSASSATGDEKAAKAAAVKAGAKKTTLPAFGFAEDLLKQRRRAGDSETTEGSGDKTGGKKEEQRTAEPPVSEPLAQPLSQDLGSDFDENRIFRFADSLERGSGESESRATPRRLQTCLTLTLAGETFALPVKPVREILRLSSITRVPHAPHPIRGVTNLRGRVLPVIDLRLRIELPEGEITRASRIVVVTSRGRLLGLLVDAVHQVVHIDLNQVQPPPDDVMTFKSDYISGVYHLGEQLVLLLDVDRTLIVREIAPRGHGEHAAAPGAA